MNPTYSNILKRLWKHVFTETALRFSRHKRTRTLPGKRARISLIACANRQYVANNQTSEFEEMKFLCANAETVSTCPWIPIFPGAMCTKPWCEPNSQST